MEVPSGGAMCSCIVEVHYGGAQKRCTEPKSTKGPSSLFIPLAFAISLFIHCSFNEQHFLKEQVVHSNEQVVH